MNDVNTDDKGTLMLLNMGFRLHPSGVTCAVRTLLNTFK
jgi:hypothetical protein